ncbi:hypothetical protein ACWDXD_20070 [Streptomyces sp. NPDC003314]
MPTFKNPEDVREIFPQHLGTIWEAARVAKVKPGTIRVWESRGKIERVRLAGGEPLYHLPTVEKASEAKPGRRWAV